MQRRAGTGTRHQMQMAVARPKLVNGCKSDAAVSAAITPNASQGWAFLPKHRAKPRAACLQTFHCQMRNEPKPHQNAEDTCHSLLKQQHQNIRSQKMGDEIAGRTSAVPICPQTQPDQAFFQHRQTDAICKVLCGETHEHPVKIRRNQRRSSRRCHRTLKRIAILVLNASTDDAPSTIMLEETFRVVTDALSDLQAGCRAPASHHPGQFSSPKPRRTQKDEGLTFANAHDQTMGVGTRIDAIVNSYDGCHCVEANSGQMHQPHGLVIFFVEQAKRTRHARGLRPRIVSKACHGEFQRHSF